LGVFPFPPVCFTLGKGYRFLWHRRLGLFFTRLVQTLLNSAYRFNFGKTHPGRKLSGPVPKSSHRFFWGPEFLVWASLVQFFPLPAFFLLLNSRGLFPRGIWYSLHHFQLFRSGGFSFAVFCDSLFFTLLVVWGAPLDWLDNFLLVPQRNFGGGFLK